MTPIKVFRHYDPLAIGHNTSKQCDVEIHLHDGYEIFQALSPNIRYFVEGNAYDMSMGDVVITSTKEIHRPITINDGVYSRRFIHFNPEIIQLFKDLPYSPLNFFDRRKPGLGNYIPIPSDDLERINALFLEIENSLQDATPRRLYQSRLCLLQLLQALELLHQSSATVAYSPEFNDPRIKEVRTYLDEHFTNKFDLQTISNYHHIDKYHLSHLFKSSTGFSLLEYVQSKRIQKAKSLMIENLSISEISRLCGFDDYTNFYKTFKKLVQESPKHYRDHKASVLLPKDH